jgi:hypothetical protein
MDLVSSHQRLLIAAALRTTGPILELGCGWYSTPLLHEIAVVGQRYLVTLDSQEPWLGQFRPELEHRYHQLKLVDWWEDAKLDPRDYGLLPARWSLVFVDHGPAVERYYVTKRLLTPAHQEPTVFVFHDTEEGRAYGYDRILPKFKFTWVDESQPVHTTLASNSVDFASWNLAVLRPRGLTEDVT